MTNYIIPVLSNFIEPNEKSLASPFFAPVNWQEALALSSSQPSIVICPAAMAASVFVSADFNLKLKVSPVFHITPVQSLFSVYGVVADNSAASGL